MWVLKKAIFVDWLIFGSWDCERTNPVWKQFMVAKKVPEGSLEMWKWFNSRVTEPILRKRAWIEIASVLSHDDPAKRGGRHGEDHNEGIIESDDESTYQMPTGDAQPNERLAKIGEKWVWDPADACHGDNLVDNNTGGPESLVRYYPEWNEVV